MSQWSNSDRMQRWLGVTGAVAVIAIPIALIAATWRPLEPLPRGERPAVVEEDQVPGRTREERQRNRDANSASEQESRNDRGNGASSAPMIATPDS